MIRNMVGYGQNALQMSWPEEAKIAVNFVINYEEGAELSPLNGDRNAETYGGEFPLVAKAHGMRSLSMETIFEYGSRAGIWRLLRLFDKENIPLTFFVTGVALQLNTEFAHYLALSTHEVAGHGWRWIDYSHLSREEEKKHIEQCVRTIAELTGKTPKGWYTGRCSEHTRPLLLEIGGFLYDSDSYADDLPYLQENHLIIPYTLDCNDFRFSTSPGFATAGDFFTHLKNSFDYLNEEDRTAIMTVGLHPRISGRPGRTAAIKQFIEYIKQFPQVWITRRVDIAQYWLDNF